MTVAKQTITCPYCREPIIAGATRCKHCQADLAKKDESKKASRFGKYSTFRIGFLVGVLFSIVIAILAYFQFRP
jgi:hypothetical protein